MGSLLKFPRQLSVKGAKTGKLKSVHKQSSRFQSGLSHGADHRKPENSDLVQEWDAHHTSTLRLGTACLTSNTTKLQGIGTRQVQKSLARLSGAAMTTRSI